mmetsp:Transcript_25195/g.64468  ORF Transcript_25195/g.64468 Transcript_25195/m.64468 type:complete len:424 (+) Transcript_25195:2917-4188(+)
MVPIILKLHNIPPPIGQRRKRPQIHHVVHPGPPGQRAGEVPVHRSHRGRLGAVPVPAAVEQGDQVTGHRDLADVDSHQARVAVVDHHELALNGGLVPGVVTEPGPVRGLGIDLRGGVAGGVGEEPRGEVDEVGSVYGETAALHGGQGDQGFPVLHQDGRDVDVGEVSPHSGSFRVDCHSPSTVHNVLAERQDKAAPACGHAADPSSRALLGPTAEVGAYESWRFGIRAVQGHVGFGVTMADLMGARREPIKDIVPAQHIGLHRLRPRARAHEVRRNIPARLPRELPHRGRGRRPVPRIQHGRPAPPRRGRRPQDGHAVLGRCWQLESRHTQRHRRAVQGHRLVGGHPAGERGELLPGEHPAGVHAIAGQALDGEVQGRHGGDLLEGAGGGLAQADDVLAGVRDVEVEWLGAGGQVPGLHVRAH